MRFARRPFAGASTRDRAPSLPSSLTVEALSAALDLRDDETGDHAHRVAELALTLARAVDPNLASERPPYRQARSISEALHEIQSGAGTQFDPAIVEAFLPIAFEFAETPLLPWPASTR